MRRLALLAYAATMAAADDPEVSSLLAALSELLEARRRAALLAERLAARASLTADEARDVRHEIQTVRDGAERMDAMITMRRQNLRPM
jgi:hypothetical protein